jgi:hypothetical protein
VREVGRRVAIVVTGAALLATACGGISTTELDEESQARGGGLGESLPLEALARLEEELGEEPQLAGFTMSRDSLSVSVLVPGSDDELDSYVYQSNGNLIGPDPVNGAGTPEEIAAELIQVDEVAFDELDEIVDDALAHTDFEGGYAQTVGIHRIPGQGIRITVSVQSPRRNGDVAYRADGTRIEAAP